MTEEIIILLSERNRKLEKDILSCFIRYFGDDVCITFDDISMYPEHKDIIEMAEWYDYLAGDFEQKDLLKLVQNRPIIQVEIAENYAGELICKGVRIVTIFYNIAKR